MHMYKVSYFWSKVENISKYGGWGKGDNGGFVRNDRGRSDLCPVAVKETGLARKK